MLDWEVSMIDKKEWVLKILSMVEIDSMIVEYAKIIKIKSKFIYYRNEIIQQDFGIDK